MPCVADEQVARIVRRRLGGEGLERHLRANARNVAELVAMGGNKAAGTRVRKKMQEIKAAAQQVRIKILEGRDTGSPGHRKAAEYIAAEFERAWA